MWEKYNSKETFPKSQNNFNTLKGISYGGLQSWWQDLFVKEAFSNLSSGLAIVVYSVSKVPSRTCSKLCIFLIPLPDQD